MPSCRLYDLSSHEVGDVVLLTPRQPGFSLEFTFMQGRVTARLLAISQDGSRISCLEHNTLSIGNTSSGEMRKLANRTDFQYMLAIGFSADGHQLLVADQRCHIHSKDVDNVCSDWVDLPPAEEVGASMRAARATFSHDGVYCAFIVEYRDYSNPTNPWPNPNLFLRRVHTNSPLHLLNHSRTMTDFDKVVFTPNAQYLVQSSALSIVVWNVDQRTLHAQGLIANPRSYELGTYITALAPISNTVCSSLTSDGAVYIWNINDGSLLRKFDGDNSLILDHPRSTTRLVALSTLGSEPLLGLMINSTVKVLDVTAKDPVITQHTFHPHPLFGFISSIILDGLSSRIYLIDHGDQLVCWNYKLTSTPGPGKVDFSSAIRCTAFSSDGGLLVSGSQDGSITIWQTTTNRQIAKHTGKGAISSVAFSTSSARFMLSVQYETDHADGLFISNCQTFEVVDANTGEIKTACQINSCPSAHDLALSPNGERLALQLAMDDRIVGLYLLNGHSGKVIARDLYDLVDQWNMRTELLFTQDSHSLIQRRGEQPILIRDAQTLEIRRTISYNGLVMNTYPALTLSPRSSHVGLVYQDGCHVRFQAWNIQSGALEISGALVQVLQDSSYFNIWLCIWTPRYSIYASKDSVTTWDSDDSTPATVHKWPKAWKVEDVCVSHDESCLYAWCGDQRIRAWTTADFNITRPILELETSEWMERLPPGWHLHQRYLICASHDATHFQAVFSVQRTYFILTVDLASRNCVSMTHLGEHRLITGANISFIDNRLYTYGPVGGCDKSDLLPYLTWIPIGNDYDAADWAQTVGDAFEVLQGMLLQVWNMETGEMEAIVKWTEDNTQLESVPSSSSLRLPRGQYGQNTSLNAVYDDPSDSWIRIYSTLSSSTHVCSIGTSPDRRPSGPTAFAIHDRLVAIGSTHGTVSIFDVTKAVEIAEAKKKLEQGSSTQAT
jgi:WD40 repeat protein